MKKIISFIVMTAVAAGIFFGGQTAAAFDPLANACSGGSQEVCNNTTSVPSVIATIINVLLFIVGVVSVIMIIVGGIMYAVSAGDSGQVSKAKNTILYSVVGLVAALLAYAIVHFVVDRLK